MKKKGKDPEPTQTETQPQAPPPSKRPPTPKTVNMRSVRVLRVVLWVLLSFVFLRGLGAIMFPADTEQLISELGSKLVTVEQHINPTSEMTAFAESFAREYFTYQPHQNDDYKNRLGRYCNSRLASDICDGVNLRGGAAASYTAALTITPYSDTQQDITVQVVVDYITEVPATIDGKEVLQQTTTSYTSYIIVPLSITPDGYLVEDMPLVTAPPAKASSYEQLEVSGTTADERIKQAAETVLGDFFKTLYSEEQRRIDYYLTEDANRDRLREIKSSLRFDKVDTLAVYKGAAANSYTGIVTLRMTDPSGTVVKQRLNISLVENGSRLYVKDINLRSHNLKG